MFQGDNSQKIYCENFLRPRGHPHPDRTLPANHRAPNHFRFFARIARCIAVIGGTGGGSFMGGGGVACQCAFVLCGAEVCRMLL